MLHQFKENASELRTQAPNQDVSGILSIAVVARHMVRPALAEVLPDVADMTPNLGYCQLGPLASVRQMNP